MTSLHCWLWLLLATMCCLASAADKTTVYVQYSSWPPANGQSRVPPCTRDRFCWSLADAAARCSRFPSCQIELLAQSTSQCEILAMGRPEQPRIQLKNRHNLEIVTNTTYGCNFSILVANPGKETSILEFLSVTNSSNITLCGLDFQQVNLSSLQKMVAIKTSRHIVLQNFVWQQSPSQQSLQNVIHISKSTDVTLNSSYFHSTRQPNAVRQVITISKSCRVFLNNVSLDLHDTEAETGHGVCIRNSSCIEVTGCTFTGDAVQENDSALHSMGRYRPKAVHIDLGSRPPCMPENWAHEQARWLLDGTYQIRDHSSNATQPTSTNASYTGVLLENCLFRNLGGPRGLVLGGKLTSEETAVGICLHVVMKSNLPALVHISHSRFERNSYYYGSPAYVSLGGTKKPGKNVLFHNCSFDSNFGSFGGAIGLHFGSKDQKEMHDQVLISSCWFNNNHAYYEGGALYAYLSWRGATWELLGVQDSHFENNSADAGGLLRPGGAVMIRSDQNSLNSDDRRNCLHPLQCPVQFGNTNFNGNSGAGAFYTTNVDIGFFGET